MRGIQENQVMNEIIYMYHAASDVRRGDNLYSPPSSTGHSSFLSLKKTKPSNQNICKNDKHDAGYYKSLLWNSEWDKVESIPLFAAW